MKCIQRLLALSFCLAGAVSLCLAQFEKPWNYEGKNYWGMGGIIYITGFTADEQLVSGTNVNFAFYVNAGVAALWDPPVSPPPGTHPYNRVKITSVTMKIGGTTVYTGSGASSPGATDSVWKAVRYASTNFNDGSEIKLELDATFELSCVPTGPGTVPPPYTLTFDTLTIKNVAYNKGLTLATKEELYTPPPDNSTDPPTVYPRGYYVVNPPFAKGYAKASQDAMPSARSALGTAKHTILNSSNFLSESELEPLLKQATCFFGFTHGETTYFRSTQDDELYFFGTPNEVASYVQSGRTALPFNMVVLHACNTVGASGNGSWQAPAAFQLTGVPGVIPNKAYASFTAIVWSLTQDDSSLKKHAEVVYEHLVGGATIDEAVSKANKDFLPRDSRRGSLKMVIRGDEFAKIVNVYQNKAELAQEDRSGSWFWVR